MYPKSSWVESCYLYVVRYLIKKIGNCFPKQNKQKKSHQLVFSKFPWKDKYTRGMLCFYFLPFNITESCSVISSFSSPPTHQREMRGETEYCYVDDCHKSLILLIILCVSVVLLFWILTYKKNYAWEAIFLVITKTSWIFNFPLVLRNIFFHTPSITNLFNIIYFIC